MIVAQKADVDTNTRQDVKHNAGAILTGDGRSLSGAISSSVPARDTMTEAEFHAMMAIGYAQAKADDSFDIDEVFDRLGQGL